MHTVIVSVLYGVVEHNYHFDDWCGPKMRRNAARILLDMPLS